MIEPNGDVYSGVATLDRRSRKKKIPMNNTKTVIIIMMYFTISQAHNIQQIFTPEINMHTNTTFLYGLHIDCLGHKPFKCGQAFFQNDDKTHRAQNVYLSRPT